MKKKFKILLGTVALSSLAMLATGCNLIDWVDGEIDKIMCNHVFDSGVVQEEATCTEYGKTLYTCAVCGETELRNVDKLFHTEKTLEKVSPTCTETGLTSGKICEVCDTIIVEQTVIPALGHKLTIRKGTKETCTTAGMTDEEYCVRCNEVLTPSIVIPATGHNPSVVLGYEASCVTYGLTDGNECSNCGELYVEQVKISPLGHDYVNEICIRCSDSTNFLKSTFPNGYTMKAITDDYENALGSIYCLGDASNPNTLAVYNTGGGGYYLFDSNGFRCDTLAVFDNEQCNATMFEVDGLLFVQLPVDEFVCTWVDSNGESHERRYTYMEHYRYNRDFISDCYFNEIMRLYACEEPLEGWIVEDDTNVLVDSYSLTFNGEEDSIVVLDTQPDGLELSFDFADISNMDEPFYLLFGENSDLNMSNSSYIEFSKNGIKVLTLSGSGKPCEIGAYDNVLSSLKLRIEGTSIYFFDSSHTLVYKYHARSYVGSSYVSPDIMVDYVAMYAPKGCAVTLNDIITVVK